MPESAGRVFLVTGCAGGIGQRLADRLLGLGHSLVATDIDEAALAAHATAARWPEERALRRRLDVTDAAQWEAAVAAAVARFGRLDVLVNMAGYLRPGWLHETAPDEIHRHFDINAKGVAFGTQAGARRMIEQGQGHIINVCSLAGLAPIAGLGLYSASKYAVRSLTLSAAMELRPRGVAVSLLCPDAVQTRMLDIQKDRAEAALTFSGAILTPDDVVDAIVRRILPRRPLETWLPFRRGLLARVGDLFPGLSFALAPYLSRKGRKRQARLRPAGE